MITGSKKLFFHFFSTIDSILKFPNLKKGEIGIQLGFDMTSAITSDLFEMCKRVSNNGKIIGIDPDPFNHQIAHQIIQEKRYNVQLIQKGTYSKKGNALFLLGKKSSWNQLKNIPKDSTVLFTNNEVEIEIDTLDNIIADLNIKPESISHINLTINGAEFDTLKGMDSILRENKNISLTVVAGRHDESGTINGSPDYQLIIELLNSYGFKTKFKRINHLFWWGFVVKLLINRKWIYNQPNYGVIMAYKGNKTTKWYQSYS